MFPAPGAKTALLPGGRAERSAVRAEIASPSGSEAVTGMLNASPSRTVTVAGAVVVGARSSLFTVIVNDLLLVRGGEPLSVAVTVAPYVPESENPGARRTFPVAGLGCAVVGVTVMNAGPAAFVNVREFPSGSEPVIA